MLPNKFSVRRLSRNFVCKTYHAVSVEMLSGELRVQMFSCKLVYRCYHINLEYNVVSKFSLQMLSF